MSPTRRDFLRGVGASAFAIGGYNIIAHDVVAELIAETPKNRVLESKFKGLADIVLGEAKLGGCSYADVRFTMTSTIPGASANFTTQAEGGRGGRGGGRGGGGGGGGFGGRGGGGGVVGVPSEADRKAAGLGVRVIHSGVWGFASSPIVTEDEIRRITRVAVEVARASAIAKKSDVKLAPVQKYVENYVTPMKKNPTTISQTEKQAWAQAIVDKASKVQGVTGVNVGINHGYEWRYFASTEGSYIEQEIYTTSPNFSVTAKVGDVTKTRNYNGVGGTAGGKSPKSAISSMWPSRSHRMPLIFAPRIRWAPLACVI